MKESWDVEAAFALLSYASKLSWDYEEPLGMLEQVASHAGQFKTHGTLRRYLTMTAIEHFDKGMLWEYAVHAALELFNTNKSYFNYGYLGEIAVNFVDVNCYIFLCSVIIFCRLRNGQNQYNGLSLTMFNICTLFVPLSSPKILAAATLLL